MKTKKLIWHIRHENKSKQILKMFYLTVTYGNCFVLENELANNNWKKFIAN